MKTEEQLLSAYEAACVTGMPHKQVRRIIDAGLLRDFVKLRNGKRMIFRRALVGLKLAYETTEILTLEGRRRLVRRVLEDPDARTVREGVVSVDAHSMKNDVKRGIASLEKAKKIVVSNKEILSGVPCFKGTRIAVHDIAAMRANGDQVASLLEAYPTLSEGQVIAAECYAKAYPRDFRSPKQPIWRKGKQNTSKVVKFNSLAGHCKPSN